MRIILTPEEIKRRKEEYKETEKRNMICPCCGEDKPEYDYYNDNIYNQGVHEGWTTRYKNCIFKKYNLHYRSYECYTCGARWEGDPYKIYKL